MELKPSAVPRAAVPAPRLTARRGLQGLRDVGLPCLAVALYARGVSFLTQMEYSNRLKGDVTWSFSSFLLF